MISSSLSRSPPRFGLHERRGEVVAGPPPPIGHHVGVVGGQGERRLGPLGGDVGHALLAVHDGSASRRSSARSAAGTPTSSRDHVHRQEAGEVRDEVEGAPLHGRLEVLDGQLADAGLELGHPPGGEALADERAQPGVGRRVHGQERHRPVGVGAEGGGVERHAVGVGEAAPTSRKAASTSSVARQCPEVELVVAVERGLGPQPGVGRVGVLVDGVVVGVVDGRPHRRGAHRPDRTARAARRRTTPSSPAPGPSVSRAAASASRSGSSAKSRWPSPAESMAPMKVVSSTRSDGRVGAAAEGRLQPAVDLRADLAPARAGRRGRGPAGPSCRRPPAPGGRRCRGPSPARRRPPVRATGRRVSTSGGGSAWIRRHSTSARRWSLELK